MRVRRLAPLIAVVALLLVTEPASAGTVYLTGTGQSKTLHFDAAPGETNEVSFIKTTQNGNDSIWVVDNGPATAGTGCTQPQGFDTVFCDLAPVIAIDVQLGDGNDVAFESAPLDLPMHVTGDAGDDWITGSSGADSLDGGTGNDDLNGKTGADDLVGGDGTDNANFSGAMTPLTISLDDVANDGVSGQNGNVHGDVENVTGGMADDTITGNAANNAIYGGDGGDTIHGGGGNDTISGSNTFLGGTCVTEHLFGDAGNDDITVAGSGSTVDGGDDDDIIHLESICTSLEFNGGAGTDTLFFAGAMSLDDVANDGAPGTGTSNIHSDIENLHGYDGPDILVGSSGPNVLDGGAGDDILDGAGGADVMNGGSDTDVVDYSARTAPLHVDLDGAAGDDGETGEGDTVGDDVEVIWGGSGADNLTGGAGNDVIDGGGGADAIAGGPGEDAVDYSIRSGNVTADLSGSTGDDGEAGEGDSIAADVEDVFGGSGADTLTGSAGPNVLDGGPGNDSLSGSDDADYLDGGDDDDTLDGGTGVDAFSGGSGQDIVLMRDATTESAACGDGDDTVTADKSDTTDADCETVDRPTTTRTTTSPIRTPTTTPTTATPAIADTTAPVVTLALSATKLRRALSAGLRLRVSCDSLCSSDIKVTISAKVARKLGFRKVKGPVTVATGARAAVDEQSYVVVVRFNRKARARLARAKTLALRLSAGFADPLGNNRTLVRKIALKR